MISDRDLIIACIEAIGRLAERLTGERMGLRVVDSETDQRFLTSTPTHHSYWLKKQEGLAMDINTWEMNLVAYMQGYVALAAVSGDQMMLIPVSDLSIFMAQAPPPNGQTGPIWVFRQVVMNRFIREVNLAKAQGNSQIEMNVSGFEELIAQAPA